MSDVYRNTLVDRFLPSFLHRTFSSFTLSSLPFSPLIRAHPLRKLVPLSSARTRLSCSFILVLPSRSSRCVSRSNRECASELIANIISSSSYKRGRLYLNDCPGVLTTPFVYEVDLAGHSAGRGKSSETHY